MIGISVFLTLLLQEPSIEQMAKHPRGNPVRLRDGGFCAGVSWIIVRRGEAVTVDYGPDFFVYRVRGPGKRQWGVYDGFAGQSSPDRAHPLIKDGVTVYRGIGGERTGTFNGYFVGDAAQNHFFGNVFRDAPSDRTFFKRVRFGDAARRLCAQTRK